MAVYPDSFPQDFETRILPAEASFTSHKAYRIAKYGAKDPRSYLCSWDEAVMEEKDLTSLLATSEEERYSTSFSDRPEALEYILSVSMRVYPAPELVTGTTDPSCGPSLVGKLKKLKGKHKGEYHHHISWWIYSDAEPWNFFEKEER